MFVDLIQILHLLPVCGPNDIWYLDMLVVSSLRLHTDRRDVGRQ